MDREQPRRPPSSEQTDDIYLPTVSLVYLPHPTIPDLYQRCFEYIEPWQWSPTTELVETEQWVRLRKPGTRR